jgi:hypothetical protein
MNNHLLEMNGSSSSVPVAPLSAATPRSYLACGVSATTGFRPSSGACYWPLKSAVQGCFKVIQQNDL